MVIIKSGTGGGGIVAFAGRARSERVAVNSRPDFPVLAGLGYYKLINS